MIKNVFNEFNIIKDRVVLALVLYNMMIVIFFPFIVFKFLKKILKYQSYKIQWYERFTSNFSSNSIDFWVHAVSLGESIAATPLVKNILDDYPNSTILVTNMTPTGREYIEKQFINNPLYYKRVKQRMLPYDLPWLMSRFVKLVNPRILILVETELWPNMLNACKHNRVTTVLFNARMSEKSKKGFSKIASLTQYMASCIDLVLVQNDIDGTRLCELGFDQQSMHTVGSVKYDMPIPKSLVCSTADLKNKWSLNRPVWVAASTHEGEEILLLKAHQHLLKRLPNALLILVPRHPERFVEVADTLDQLSFDYIKRSSGLLLSSDHSIVLADSMGEMLLWYSIADVAFVGGSLIPVGGHNVLEPALLKTATLIGSHYFNFQTIVDDLDACNGIKILNETIDDKEIADIVFKVLTENNVQQTLTDSAFKYVKKSQGALNRSLKIIEQYFNKIHQ